MEKIFYICDKCSECSVFPGCGCPGINKINKLTEILDKIQNSYLILLEVCKHCNLRILKENIKSFGLDIEVDLNPFNNTIRIKNYKSNNKIFFIDNNDPLNFYRKEGKNNILITQEEFLNTCQNSYIEGCDCDYNFNNNLDKVLLGEKYKAIFITETNESSQYFKVVDLSLIFL